MSEGQLRASEIVGRETSRDIRQRFSYARAGCSRYGEPPLDARLRNEAWVIYWGLAVRGRRGFCAVACRQRADFLERAGSDVDADVRSTEKGSARTRPRALVVAVVAIGTLVGLVGCQSASGVQAGGLETPAEENVDTHVTRAKLYSSTDELAADSAPVVIGTVQDQRVADDIEEGLDFTISTISVSSSLSGSAEGTASVEVRQVGSAEQAPPTPLLAPGNVYLLYRAESGLEAPLDRQYYVTGGNAGVYKLEEKQVSARQLDSIETGALDATELGSLTFIQVDPEEGEQLPIEVQSDQL